jgi:hypothetical protein
MPKSTLSRIAEQLDISATDYERAVRSYSSVGKWVEEGFPKEDPGERFSKPVIYPQGSIALGTIVKPLRAQKDPEFDIDLVTELSCIDGVTAGELKHKIGDRLRQHGTYSRLLDEEGSRCWTVIYSESGDVAFHIDVLPARSIRPDGEIGITHRIGSDYTWKSSNPTGFARWFRAKNINFYDFETAQKQQLSEESRSIDGKRIYASVEDVPDQLVRTPLQRAIQVLKRHRDVRFAKSAEFRPISIIITTLAARLYRGESTPEEALSHIVDALQTHSVLIKDVHYGEQLRESSSGLSLISRRLSEEGVWEWYVPNPVNPSENFADKWHLDGDRRAKEFFGWVEQAKIDLADLESAVSRSDQEAIVERAFGSSLPHISQESPRTEDDYPTVVVRQENRPKPWMTSN